MSPAHRIHTSTRANAPTLQSGQIGVRIRSIPMSRTHHGRTQCAVAESRSYSALTAAVSAARPSFASAKSIPVFSFVYSSLSMPA